MPNNDLVVGAIKRLEWTVARVNRGGKSMPLTIEFADGRTARFDPDDPRSEQYGRLLEDLNKAGTPISVEVDPRTGVAKLLRIPLEVTVDTVVPCANGDTEVTLTVSQARHVVRANNPNRDALVKQLERARDAKTVVLVTEDDDGIIDVQPALGPAGSRFPGLTGTPPAKTEPPATCITEQRAKQLFALCAATTCAPNTVPPPCIPFMYPDNGCWARAHEMCRLILAQGVQPKKVWIHGHLDAATRNRSNCLVAWAWHVAPIVCVEDDYTPQHMEVIDPSLFTGPVTEAVWKGVQGDPAATLTETDAALYLEGNQYDPTYARTVADLANFRNLLNLRWINDHAPPYANCP
jgi:glutaminase-like protein